MILFLYYLLVLPLTARTVFLAFSSNLQDYSVYIQTTQNFLHHLDPYTGLIYPPASILFFIPFTQTPFFISKIIWTLLGLISLYLAVYIFVKEFKVRNILSLSLAPRNTALVIFLFFLQTFPVKFTLGLGQINFFVLLGYSILLYCINRKMDILSGLILCFIAILKFNPIFFVLYFLITKKYKSVSVFIFSFIFFNLIIDLFSPYPLNSSFVHSIIIMSSNYSTYYYNQSLAAFIGRVILDPTYDRVFTNLLTMIFWLATIKLHFKAKKFPNSLFVLYLTTITLTSPLSWQHHLVFTIPVFIYLFNLLPKKRSLLSLLSVTVAFLLININLKNPTIFLPQNLVYSHAFFGLALLWALQYRLASTED